MVGWLVKNQQVWISNQHIGQGHTLLLTSAQLSHGLLQVANLQLSQNLLCLQHLLWVSLMIETRIQDTLHRIEHRRLLQHSHPQVTTEDDFARVIPLLAREHRQQRRFARTILGYQSHLLPFGNRETDILKKHQRAKRLRQSLHIQVWNLSPHLMLNGQSSMVNRQWSMFNDLLI